MLSVLDVLTNQKCVFVLVLCLVVFSLVASTESMDNDDVEEDNDEPFIPTNEWQQVKPGQAIPSGLHVKMDLSNGGKWAKLMDDGKTSQKSSLQLAPDANKEEEPAPNDIKGTYSIDELKQSLKKMKQEKKEASKETSEDIKSKFRSMDEIRKDFDALNLHQETDVEVMQRLIATLRLKTSDVKEKLAALQDLEYYVHQIDNAVDLFNIGGFGDVLKQLNNTDASLREEAAHTIGSAIQSNPTAQIKAYENGLLTNILRLISDSQQPIPVRKKCLYCLSALLRHFPYAQLKLYENGGFTELRNVYHQEVGETIKIKIIQLLNDLVTERQTTLLQDEDTHDKKEKLKQYERLPLAKLIKEDGWCKAIVDALQTDNHGSREMVLQAIKSIYPTCSQKFLEHGAMDAVLRIKMEYKTLSEEEISSNDPDGYYTLMHNLVSEVIGLLKNGPKAKDEL
uniref:Nucleotide exchange factor SIL1 n=1 Tax=Phallusia mammillata TaxID=59560 RepID=A0A6F9DRK3_9ASCI|nr:nucleotide exchange factor SIL1-like [Phallusia mammillata]